MKRDVIVRLERLEARRVPDEAHISKAERDEAVRRSIAEYPTADAFLAINGPLRRSRFATVEQQRAAIEAAFRADG